MRVAVGVGNRQQWVLWMVVDGGCWKTKDVCC